MLDNHSEGRRVCNCLAFLDLRDFSPTSRYSADPRCSGILRNVDSYLLTDFSVHPIDRVLNYQATLRSIPDERGSRI
jgi:hypothetical protein